MESGFQRIKNQLKKDLLTVRFNHRQNINGALRTT